MTPTVPGHSLPAYTPDLTFRVTNFKSIASVELPPSRLVVLAGSNSSGKSSLLQAALFMTQSLAAEAPVINGDLVILGEPKDVIRDGAKNVSFEFSFDFTGPEDEPTKQIAYRVTLAKKKDELTPFQVSLYSESDLVFCAESKSCPADLRRRLPPRETVLQLADAKSLKLPEESFLTVVGMQPARLIYRASEEYLRRSFDELVKAPIPDYMVQELLFDLTRSHRSTGIPPSLRERISALQHGRPFRGDRAQLSPGEADALFSVYAETLAPDGWASEGITMPPLGRGGAFRTSFAAGPAGKPTVFPLVRQMEDAASKMRGFRGSVVYLGPLRDDPRVAYPLGHTVSNLPVGGKGEFTAAFLDKNRARHIRYRDPEGKVTGGSLISAASQWCSYLGIAEKVSVSAKAKLGHELSLELDGHDRDPTAIGVGASQLLPVVVTVLGAKSGQLILLEQPELHLHPKVQSRLADFFAFARPDVQILVETHSEYLITRLRVRAAEGDLDPRQVAALFVSKRAGEVVPTVEGEEPKKPEYHSEFKPLALDDFGNFNAWPEDFFDSLERDSVDLANAVTERLRERRKDDNEQK
jgi:predicted ATPase